MRNKRFQSIIAIVLTVLLAGTAVLSTVLQAGAVSQSDIDALKSQAAELAGRLRGMQCHVNLIPLNVVEERELKGVTEKTVRSFMDTLEKLHISVTRRREMGDDIEGACGQLRRRYIKENEEN